MKKNLFKKALVFGIMLAFVTISTLPSIASNNHSIVSSVNPISAQDNQKNPNYNGNYVIIWAANASVIFDRPSHVDIILDCDPDCEVNISVPGPDVYLIFLLGTTIKLEYVSILPKFAGYYLFADIDNIVRYDKTIMRMGEPDTRSNILGMGYLLENVHNETVDIKIKVTVKSLLFPPKSKDCERNVILHITASESDPPSEATNGNAGVE